jgi:hypothetical protein
LSSGEAEDDKTIEMVGEKLDPLTRISHTPSD